MQWIEIDSPLNPAPSQHSSMKIWYQCCLSNSKIYKLFKAVEREEKLKDKILSIQSKYKLAEGRFEYGEMNITKLNQRIDDIEDEIYREKLKIKKCSDELNDTFDDMLANY